ncbi:MAG: hypothetical protein DRK00_01865 [Thermoprotei archaeon]|nr:MAG: hypothetical protein DRK00_01865 [Thermoprotei archaeon]
MPALAINAPAGSSFNYIFKQSTIDAEARLKSLKDGALMHNTWRAKFFIITLGDCIVETWVGM